MSWDINQVTLVGRLTRDPEIRYGQSGTAYCTLSVAVNRKAFREGAEDEVYFFDVKTFGKSAEFCGQYLTKGRQVAVSGYLSQNRWEDQSGQKRSKVEVVADRVQFLGSGSGQGQGPAPASKPASEPPQTDYREDFPEDDDIPF